MSCVLEILSNEELLTRKTNLIKQLEKVDNELLKRKFEINIDNIIEENNTQLNHESDDSIDLSKKSKKIKIKVNIVRKR
jgi:hypothetical protein